MSDIYCPFCGRKVTVGHFCMGCGRDLSAYITEERETTAPDRSDNPLPDLGGLARLAEEEARKKKIEEDFEIEGGVLKHYRGGGETVEVPSWVTVIGEEAFRGTYAEKVVLPEGITAIERMAFCRSYLRQLNLPQSLRRIGAGAFARSNIEELHIPAGVTEIGEKAFSGCKNMKLHVHLREYCEATMPGEYSTALEDIAGLYADGRLVENLTVPSGTSRVGRYAFAHYAKLKSASLGGVREIGDAAFGWCQSLASVTLGSSLTTIGASAFDSCENLRGIVIPDSVTHIGTAAFSCCEKLTSVTLSRNLREIPTCAFSSTGVISVTIPDGVSLIRNDAFACCPNLESVTLPISVRRIEERAFYKCPRLRRVIVSRYCDIDRAFDMGCNIIRRVEN